jgi:hypothetical protein
VSPQGNRALSSAACDRHENRSPTPGSSKDAKLLSVHSAESTISRYEDASVFSGHLIITFLTKAFFKLDVIDWQEFGKTFDKAGRRVDAMGPLGQVFCRGWLGFSVSIPI